MPKTIADERIKLVALTTKPASLSAVEVGEANAGVDLSCRIMMSDFRLSPTASDTVNEPALCEGGNSAAPGKSNYEGSLTPFRFLDVAGAADTANDVAYAALKEKGTELWLIKRVGPKYDEPFAVGDDIEVYHVFTDNPQDPSEFTGYIKKVVPLFVQGDSEINATIVADTP